MCCIHTVQYYSAIRRNEVMIQDTTWMKLKYIMLSERSPTQKAAYCYDSIYMKCPTLIWINVFQGLKKRKFEGVTAYWA